MLRLWKRTPGTPLSPAERRQRQEAAEASADKRRGQGNAGRASLDMFRAEIRNIPVLSAEQERDLTTRWARDRDAKARDQILTAHLRMSFAGARKLAGYGLPLDDLVAAGNIGLIQAIDRYDPGHNANARFATFASTYVRAAQLRHVLDNWSIVRMGTNRDQKRLFFSLREDLRQIDQNGSADAAEVIAARRGVKASAVRDMAARFTGRDTSLNTPMGDEADGDEWVDRLVGGGEHAEATLAAKQQDRLRRAAVARAMADLPERQRQVFAARWLRQPPATLQQIASELRVSSERVRQIEAQAMGNIRRSVAKDTRLNKRTPGAPLSDAELEQRRNAAKARWAAVAAGAAAGAAASHVILPRVATIKAAARVAADEQAPRRATRLAALRREVRFGRIERTVDKRYRAAGKGFNRQPETENGRPGPVTQRIRDLRALKARGPKQLVVLQARLDELETAFSRGELPKAGLGWKEATIARAQIADDLARADAELNGLLGETPATRATRAAYRGRRGQFATLGNEPLARLERYRRTVPSSISPDEMKRIRALVRAKGEQKAQSARNFVMDTWRRAIPGFADKIAERSNRALARTIRGKWRAPSLAAGALLGAGAGWTAHSLSKLTPAQISAAAGHARLPRSLAEAEAGTYRKGHVTLHGMQIAIETPKGIDRLGFAKDGTIKWRARMPAHYGYVKGSMGADGDHVDVYLGPRAHDPDCPVFVVDQHKLDGAFDEHKAVLGCADEAAALRIYDAGFADGSGPKRRRGVTQMSVAAFRARVIAGKMAEPLAKRELSEAELRQRKDAARARWEAARRGAGEFAIIAGGGAALGTGVSLALVTAMENVHRSRAKQTGRMRVGDITVPATHEIGGVIDPRRGTSRSMIGQKSSIVLPKAKRGEISWHTHPGADRPEFRPTTGPSSADVGVMVARREPSLIVGHGGSVHALKPGKRIPGATARRISEKLTSANRIADKIEVGHYGLISKDFDHIHATKDPKVRRELLIGAVLRSIESKRHAALTEMSRAGLIRYGANNAAREGLYTQPRYSKLADRYIRRFGKPTIGERLKGLPEAALRLMPVFVKAVAPSDLAKAAPDDGTWRQPDLFEDQLTTPSSDSDEKALAGRLARLFRSWLDNPGRVGNAADIAQALDPLYSILRTGADAVPPPPANGDLFGGVAESREVAVNFDMRSEEVERRLREYALDRIRAITQESRDAIRATLIEAAQSGMPVDQQARQIREAIGLSPGQQNWVSSYRAQLEALDPRALDRALRDRRHDSPIRTAIEAGTPLGADDIERYVASYQRRALAYRAMTIARTEALRGANTGMVEGARGLLNQFDDVTVEKTWIATKDGRTRDAHAELDGKRVVGLDMPFQIRDPKTGVMEQIRWPHDPQASAAMTVNCRCTFGIRLIPKPGAGRFSAEAA
jgi:RNA polymerase sigma-32 factor